MAIDPDVQTLLDALDARLQALEALDITGLDARITAIEAMLQSIADTINGV